MFTWGERVMLFVMLLLVVIMSTGSHCNTRGRSKQSEGNLAAKWRSQAAGGEYIVIKTGIPSWSYR